MTQQKNAQRPLIVGKPALIMVDFQRGGPYVPGTENGISHMDFAEERRRTARTLVAAAREAQIPVIFIQEVHRPDHVDFGGKSTAPRMCIVSRACARPSSPPRKSI